MIPPQKTIYTILLLILLTSCQNHYKTFYKQFAIYNWQNIEFYIGEAATVKSTDMAGDVANYRRRGYGVIGFSDFSSEMVKHPEVKMKKLAKEIGAEIIVWNQVYAGTVTGQYYLHTPYYKGWQSYRIDRYNYGSVFLSKLKDIGAGVFVRDLTADEKAQKHLDAGAYIAVIMDDGPALKAKLAEGDVIVKAGNKIIEEARSFETIDLENLNFLRIGYVRGGRKKRVTLDLKSNNILPKRSGSKLISED